MDGDVSMKITDVSGKVIHTEHFNASNTPVKRIATSEFAKGFYVVSLQNNNVVITKKLIVY
jgi:hypothetical protein